MHKAVDQQIRSLSFGQRFFRGVVFLCAGMLAGVMLVPSVLAEPTSKPVDKSKVQVPSKVAPVANSKSDVAPAPADSNKAGDAVKVRRGFTPLEKPARPVTRSRSVKKGRGMSTFTMNPDAKWACDKQEVALEPVWRGDQQLTFGFDIRNEGTADLKIKAKGG